MGVLQLSGMVLLVSPPAMGNGRDRSPVRGIAGSLYSVFRLLRFLATRSNERVLIGYVIFAVSDSVFHFIPNDRTYAQMFTDFVTGAIGDKSSSS